MGPGNDDWIERAAEEADRIVCAWGRHGRLHARDEAVLALLRGRRLHCFGTNADGTPRFPRALPVDVRDYEPAEALFAPAGDPDRFVRALLDHAPRVLRPGGILAVELGSDQAPRVRALASERGLTIELAPDLAGHERTLVWRRPAE